MESYFFPLCDTCASLGVHAAPKECDHTVEQRKLKGTWVSQEFEEALKQGYRILKTFEVWRYERTSRELFKKHIDKFYKIKTEASGYPVGCDTDEKRAEYVRLFRQNQGIQLDPSKIEINLGLRALSKLSLNSLWSKFGRRPDLLQTEVVKTIVRHCKMLLNPNITVESIFPVND